MMTKNDGNELVQRWQARELKSDCTKIKVPETGTERVHCDVGVSYS